MSGSATWERVGQISGLLLHWVPDNSGQAPPMISHWLGPADFTIVEHFGQRVCILRICADGGHDQATSNPCHLSALRIRFADWPPFPESGMTSFPQRCPVSAAFSRNLPRTKLDGIHTVESLWF